MELDKLYNSAEQSLAGVTDKVLSWVEQAIRMLPNALVAALVVLAFVFIAGIADRLARRGLQRASDNAQVTRLASRGLRMCIIATGLFVALGILGLDKTVSSLLAGVGILGLALGFAFQDLLANLMSGVLLAFRKPFEPGDIVETNGVMGTVEDTGISSTLLRNFEGQLVWIPNKQVLDSVLTNFTRTGVRRVEVAVGVSYGDDLELAERTCRQALEDLTFRHPDRDVDVWFTGFGGSSIDMSARLWIDLANPQTNILHARSEVIKALKQAYDRANLTIPFPIRTLDFGITGGEKLRQHLTVLQGEAGQDRPSASMPMPARAGRRNR